VIPPGDARSHPATARLPRSRWLAIGAMVVALALALLVDGYARHQVGRSSTVPPGGRVVGTGVPGGGPVLDLSGPTPRSAPLPDRTVALTFDDGPDPTWTPQILDVLRRHHVPATFFVVGAAAAEHPGLVRAELAAGNEIGAHTFTHADLGAVSPTRAGLELRLTQSTLAGAAGINTHLLRLPYSSETVDLTRPELAAARRAGDLGYLLVFATQDPEDWRQPGVGAIVAHSTPPAGQGGVVLLHDAGGDRSQTVAAVDQLITRLQAQGYRFTTVSGLAGLPPGSAVRPVSHSAHLQGLALLMALWLAHLLSRGFLLLILPFTVLALARTVLVLVLAHRQVRRPVAPATHLPPVSVIVPAYNEEVGIAAAVRSLLASDHPVLEVIVVDDGSTDATSSVVEGLTDDPRVRLIRQANSGKAAALNRGIAAARHDVIVMVDGDTIFEPDTIRHLVAPLADPGVGAVAGNTKVGNRSGLLGRWQHIEYVMGCNLERRMYEALGCIMVVPGAIGAYRREALDQVGGLSTDTLAEDTDLTIAVTRAGWRVAYESRARAWTEAPTTLRQLWRQRYRWAYGTMQAIWKHRRAFREGRTLGRVGLPSLILAQVVLPLLGPAFDVFALYGVLFVSPGRYLAYWAAFNLVGVGVALYAFRLDGEPVRPLWALPLQQFVYRQLIYLVVFESVVSALAGTRLRWHKLTRTGDLVVAGVTPVAGAGSAAATDEDGDAAEDAA